MDLTETIEKHQFIADSLTNHLAFAVQQMKVAPVHGFNKAVTKLCIMLKPDITYVKALKECSKDIDTNHYITLLINHVHFHHPQRSHFKLVFTIEGNHISNPVDIHTPIRANHNVITIFSFDKKETKKVNFHVTTPFPSE